MPIPSRHLLVHNRQWNTRAIRAICSKLTVKTPECYRCRRSGVFIFNFKQIPHCSGVSIVDFERVNPGWVETCSSFISDYST